jgi:hypothetical protein
MYTAPELPPVATPELMMSIPLRPAVPLLAVRTMKSPDVFSAAYPVTIDIRPPVCPLAVVV